jgi:hypothetical protein
MDSAHEFFRSRFSPALPSPTLRGEKFGLVIRHDCDLSLQSFQVDRFFVGREIRP